MLMKKNNLVGFTYSRYDDKNNSKIKVTLAFIKFFIKFSIFGHTTL